MEKQPVYISYIATVSELHTARDKILQAAELKFYKDEAERMAGLVQTMQAAIEEGKQVRFQGICIGRQDIAS